MHVHVRSSVITKEMFYKAHRTIFVLTRHYLWKFCWYILCFNSHCYNGLDINPFCTFVATVTCYTITTREVCMGYGANWMTTSRLHSKSEATQSFIPTMSWLRTADPREGLPYKSGRGARRRVLKMTLTLKGTHKLLEMSILYPKRYGHIVN